MSRMQHWAQFLAQELRHASFRDGARASPNPTHRRRSERIRPCSQWRHFCSPCPNLRSLFDPLPSRGGGCLQLPHPQSVRLHILQPPLTPYHSDQMKPPMVATRPRFPHFVEDCVARGPLHHLSRELAWGISGQISAESMPPTQGTVCDFTPNSSFRPAPWLSIPPGVVWQPPVACVYANSWPRPHLLPSWVSERALCPFMQQLHPERVSPGPSRAALRALRWFVRCSTRRHDSK